MALSFVGGAENSGTGATITLTMPGGIAEADVVYVCGGWASTSDDAPGVTTVGFTELAELHANDLARANFSANRKVMGVSPDSTVDCIGANDGQQGGAYVAHVWRGADTTTPEDATTTTATDINSAIPDSPSITTVTEDAVVLSAGLGADDAIGDTSVTAPTGYSNQVDIAGVGSQRSATAAIASKSIAAPGDEDPAAWTTWTTDTVDSWAAVSIAIRPAADALTGVSWMGAAG